MNVDNKFDSEVHLSRRGKNFLLCISNYSNSPSGRQKQQQKIDYDEVKINLCSAQFNCNGSGPGLKAGPDHISLVIFKNSTIFNKVFSWQSTQPHEYNKA